MVSLADLELLIPFKMVFQMNAEGHWRDTAGGALYPRLPDGTVCRLSATSHCSQALGVYISSGSSVSTRLSSIAVGVGEANVKHPEVPVTEPRHVSVSGPGEVGEQLTVEVIPMLIA